MTEKTELYRVLYEKISCIQCSDIQLETIKSIYGPKIKSARKLENVKSLDELLKLLVKRDLLNENNFEPLTEIAANCGFYNVVNLINNNADITFETDDMRKAKARVYKLLSEEIGNSWQQFARELNIKEGWIDDLERSYNKTSERIYKILIYHEKNCNKRRWRTELEDALINTRRRDLRDNIQRILDYN